MTIKDLIETAWEQNIVSDEIKDSVNTVLNLLNSGEVVICQKESGLWIVNDWVRKAILLYFRMSQPYMIDSGSFDKVPLKFHGWTETQFKSAGIRIVPGAIVRSGVYLSPGVVVMPSFINIGAFIGKNTMIDINVALGSCCYIGDNCHIGAGTVIGGVLEPLHDKPTIVENDVFIGASCSITSGVVISEGAVIAPGTHISASTKIYDSISGKIFYQVVPKDAVVVSGVLPREDGVSIAAAIIVKYADSETRKKVGLNNLLR